MNKLSKRNTLILIVAGLFPISIAQIFQHFLQLQDCIHGSFLGIGIGFLLLGLAKGNSRALS